MHPSPGKDRRRWNDRAEDDDVSGAESAPVPRRHPSHLGEHLASRACRGLEVDDRGQGAAHDRDKTDESADVATCASRVEGSGDPVAVEDVLCEHLGGIGRDRVEIDQFDRRGDGIDRSQCLLGRRVAGDIMPDPHRDLRLGVR